MMRVSEWLTRRFGLLFPLGMAALVTVLAALGLVRLDDYRREQLRTAERARVHQELELVRARLEKDISGPLLETRVIAAQIVAHNGITDEEFARQARLLIENDPNVDSFGFSRGTVIAMVYPQTKDHTWQGLDFRKSPDKWPAVDMAIRNRTPVLDGPQKLVLGGMGLALRDPVFLLDREGKESEFFGLVSIVLRIPGIFGHAGLNDEKLTIRVAVQADGGPVMGQKMLFGDEVIFHHDPVVSVLALPYATWRIAGEPKNGWAASEPWFGAPRLFSVFLFLFVGLTSFGTAVFIFQREEARRALAASQRRAAREAERFHTLLEQASDGIHILDEKGRLIEASLSFCQMLGYSKVELTGKTPTFWDALQSEEEVAATVQAELANPGTNRIETRHRRKDGTVFDVEVTGRRMKADGKMILFNSSRDITDRKNAEKQINQLAFFDQLTGLPNRTLLLDRLKTATAAGQRSGKYGALLFIDLDDFKTLNDTLGHMMGDLLLQAVAGRLLSCVRGEDTVARLGGDEFLVMTPSLGATSSVAAIECEMLAERVLLALNEPYDLESVTYRCTPSIGVTLFRGTDSSFSDLLKQADMAMYKAKAAGRNAIRFFDPGMEVAVRERAAMEADLRAAIQQGQFELHYQAQVDGSNRPIGAECLVRWRHPERGMICPGEFISLAEETSLILPLGHWVLQTACRQLAAWSKMPGMDDFTLAVNVSPRQFRQSAFVGEVLAAIDDYGANPSLLKIELTENLLVENVEEIIDKMVALRAVGVSFSLDDFGTGYSSLSYLKRLPLDQLKIDQSFVREALVDPNDAALAKTVVALGQSLGLGVIAEGVETQAQRDFLLRSGCSYFQGYLFSRPLPIGNFEEYLLRARQGV
jgi:diguanylate cyclase (GGDEF)-like protein/PAS domain S-box-containing protein